MIWQSFTCRILLFQMQWEDLVSRHFWDMKKVSITGAGHLWEWCSYAVTRVVRCTCIWQLMGVCSANNENEKISPFETIFYNSDTIIVYTDHCCTMWHTDFNCSAYYNTMWYTVHGSSFWVSDYKNLKAKKLSNCLPCPLVAIMIMPTVVCEWVNTEFVW